MKKILLSIATCICLLHGYSQSGHDIRLTLKPYRNSQVYLGYYYGKLKALADSVILNANSEGSFKGKEKLPGGVYFIVSPAKAILFEVLIDSQQHFSIVADTTNLPNSVVFKGSTDNSLFQSYTRFTNVKGSGILEAQKQLTTARSKADSARLGDKIRSLNVEIQHYREEIVVKYPKSLLATLFHVLKEPVVPPAAQMPEGRYDNVFAYHYFKSHYWDGVSFTDERLLRTPIFEPKLDKYYKDLAPPEADSLEREVDKMLLDARTSKEMFKFLLVYFVQKYVNPEIMGQDAVFVHLFEKYVNTGQAEFFTDKYRQFINNRAYSLMANLIGQPAANLEMVDTSDKAKPLYEVDAPFIVICFWDPTCSHCKETIPRVDSIYQAKWKQEGVKVYGVMVDGGHEAWVKFIRDHNLRDWIHVYETKTHQDADQAAGKPNYRQLYDVYQTPILYLLDKDKRIIAKKLSYEQFDEVINLKLKNVKSN